MASDCLSMSPKGTDHLVIPRYFVAQMATAYSVPELHAFVRTTELELFVADYWQDSTAGFWQNLLDIYRSAIPFRHHMDGYHQAKQARFRRKTEKRHSFSEIKERVDIVQYIGRYVKLKRVGKAFRGLCPFHSEKTPSFYVWPQVRGFRCFGCGAKGDVISFASMIGDGELID